MERRKNTVFGRPEPALVALITEISGRLAASAGGLSAGEVHVEIPKDPSNGDLATNVAFRLTKILRRPPLEVARSLVSALSEALPLSGLAQVIERIEVKEPGFINFFLTKESLYQVILDIKRQKGEYGSSGLGRKEKVQIEFVSANPTGPLTIAHARQAAVGNALGNILEFTGHHVTREYYINDEGTQMNILAASIRARYLDLCGKGGEFPADGYKGSYIADIAKDFKAKYGVRHAGTADLDVFRAFGYRWIMSDIKIDLKEFGVRFDVWYSQAALRKKGAVEKTLDLLRERGYVFDQDGAVWFKSTAFGDDKDRVVIKSDGSYTYLATDIAYHFDKYKRLFRRVIDIWGPDHHGYIARMKAAVQALGYQAASIDVLIVQLATLLRGGAPVSMSTRAGEFITLREVAGEMGSDVSKFIFLARKLDSHLDFDIEVAKKESSENPVFYVQYAHARICSIQRHARGQKRLAFNSRLLVEPEELQLLRELRQYPLVVQYASKNLEPNGIVSYLQTLAASFHNFYNKVRVVSDDPVLSTARLVLVDCVRIVLASGLGLLGVSLPKKM